MRIFNRCSGRLWSSQGDRGSGSLRQYRFNLEPNNLRVTLELAGSNPCQGELQQIVDSGASPLETAISRRTSEDERTDAPLEVRLFAGGRVTGVVGTVPRGLEAVVDESLARLNKSDRKMRIPVRVRKTRNGLRVELLIGQTK